MNTLKEKLLALVDTTASQAKGIIGDFNSMVNNIDWDTQLSVANEFIRNRKDSLTAKANDLLKDFSDLINQVKDNLTDFAVTVNYDESLGEKLEYEVKDGILKVEVSFKDEVTTRSNKTEVKIPDNCDVNSITKTVNKTAKTATIIIPKIFDKKDETPSDTKENEKEGKHETPASVSSKLAERLKSNVEKARLTRDSRGRFVRRTV